MDGEAIELVFENPTQAALDRARIPWVPNNRVLGIIPTIIHQTPSFNTKRQRNNNEDFNNIKASPSPYSSVTANTLRTSTNTVSDNGIELLKQQMNESVDMKLKLIHRSIDKKQHQMDTKIDNINNNMMKNNEQTNTNLDIIKNDVESKFAILQKEQCNTNIEINKISESLSSLSMFLARWEDKNADNNPNSNHQQNSFLTNLVWGAKQANQLITPTKKNKDNKMVNIDVEDEEMSDHNRISGRPVTRSMTSN
jgi:hypothetical protein